MQNKNQEIKDFEQFFRQNYEGTVRFALKIVGDMHEAEDISQQSFTNIWRQTQKSKQIDNREAYLFRTVHNLCINHLKQRKRPTSIESEESALSESLVSHPNNAKELQERISFALEKLPSKCKTIFLLSRFEQLKYQQIADTLSLSIKTVETQMSKALYILKKELQDYLIIICIIILLKK